MPDGIAPPSIAIWRPHKSFGYPKGTHGQMRNPTCILDHIMEGWKATLDSSWADDHGVGVHFGIGRNGSASQYTNLFDASWGHGVSGRRDLYNPQNNRHLRNWEDSNGARWVQVPYASTQAMALIDERGVSIPNSRAPAKEHEGFHGDRWDARMIKRSAEIDEWIMEEFWRVKRWEMTVDKDLKIGHHEIDGVNRVNCPGADWRNRVEAEILAMLGVVDDMTEIVDNDEFWKKMAKLVQAEVGSALGFRRRWNASDPRSGARYPRGKDAAGKDKLHNDLIGWDDFKNENWGQVFVIIKAPGSSVKYIFDGASKQRILPAAWKAMTTNMANLGSGKKVQMQIRELPKDAIDTIPTHGAGSGGADPVSGNHHDLVMAQLGAILSVIEDSDHHVKIEVVD